MTDEGVDISALAQALGWSVADLRLLGDLRDVPPFIEDEVERRGLTIRYVEELTEIVIHPSSMYTPWSKADVWWMLRATPEQRARAFLAALEAT